MSGTIPACSQASSVPVRPQPVITSSAMKSTPWRRQTACISRSVSAPYIIIPPAPSTSGSTMKAAGLSVRQRRSSVSSISCSCPAAGKGTVPTSNKKGS